MIRCTNCVLPSCFPQIEIDDEGVCNYCRSGYKSMAHRYTDGLDGLVKRLERLRLQYVQNDDYDCVVALSGGRDSSYVAYYVSRVLKLRPLLFVNDNGFMPPQTRENIQRIAETLDTEVVVKSHDMRQLAGKAIACWVKKPSAAMIGTFCTGCMVGIHGGLMKVVREYNVRLVLHGGGGELASLGTTFPLQLLTSSMEFSKRRLLLGFARNLASNPRYAMSPKLLGGAIQEAYYRYYFRSFNRKELKMVSLYNFVDWNEKEVTETIKREFGWERPEYCTNDWRTDCRLHRVKEYLYLESCGFTKNDVMLSTMIRRGEITRDAALERLEKENDVSAKYVAMICDDLGVEFGDVHAAVEKLKHQSAPELVQIQADELEN
ncbi:hypothetical protein CA13_25870 [Planctomycetes bacterium CA13]|uniref:Uncharacterized protein n=1 Tax=Novipirellula herctigrandis TaxID=2527986 RepID=A0A5C5Z1E9_9BACT|nr:hypothetical protein CA13_25870 [Planctomycetes bacterium CA13]